MKNSLFGTDGVRGVANVYPMTVDFAMALAMAAAKEVCLTKKRVAIAKDTRVSGDMLEAAMIAGFTSQGVDVLQMGVLPTPALTVLTPKLGVDMAVMITASHNPYHDNGIKLISADGDKFSDKVTSRLEKAVVKGNFEYDRDRIGRVVLYPEAIDEYLTTVLRAVKRPNLFKGLKIVVDCANGCFSKIMPSVFQKLGADVVALSCEPNGLNINKDCGSQHIENMCATVREKSADLGIAADGDGDRIIVCDEKGGKIDGDQILAFLGQYFKTTGELGSNTVVATIVSNPGLDRFLASKGISCVRSAVGERYVIEEMEKTGSTFGGEESGHMVASDYSKTGDCLVTALLFVQALVNTNKNMSDIFPLFQPMPRLRVDSVFGDNAKMIKAFDKPEFQDAIKDGENLLGNEGKVLVRKSGTEPKIQVWVWSDNLALAEKVNEVISGALEEAAGYVSRKKSS